MTSLTSRQSQILTFMQKKVIENGYPPTVREIGKAVGMSSPSSVHSQLKTLEKKGYIHRDPSKQRAIKILKGGIKHDN